MGFYRSKPTLVQAFQFNDESNPPPGVMRRRIPAIPGDPKDLSGCSGRAAYDEYFVTTIHGHDTPVELGDYIVQEPDGVHYYPVKADIFEKRYEAAE